jgi:Tripartite tricarboxylate transporter family receptor
MLYRSSDAARLVRCRTKRHRRQIIVGEDMRYGTSLLAGLASLMLLLQVAHADDYPSRRVVLIAPWPAAGAIDTLCREIAPGVGDRLGQPVIVENRPSASSTIGTADVAKAVPVCLVPIVLARPPQRGERGRQAPRRSFVRNAAFEVRRAHRRNVVTLI